jgi:hypothetical protein
LSRPIALIADVTTRTFSHPARASFTICAALDIASALPTDVPPNFMTGVLDDFPFLPYFYPLENKNASRFREALCVKSNLVGHLTNTNASRNTREVVAVVMAPKPFFIMGATMPPGFYVVNSV